jgi:carbamoyltransferase
MANYLGIFDGHNAAAALFVDGGIRRAIQEERLVGTKNYYGPPEKAVARLLELEGLDASQIDQVCVASRYVSTPRDPRAFKDDFDQRYHPDLRRRLVGKLALQPAYRRRRAEQRMEQRRAVVAGWGFAADKVEFYDHHRTHAATAYYGLRQDDEPYLVLTLDGGGDGLSGSVWRGQGGELECLATIPQADSLGEIYAVTTHQLGFMPLEHEYKLMGMAPYASEEYAETAARIYRSYLGLDTENLRFKRKTSESLAMLGPRLQRDLGRLRFDSVCGGLQMFTEEMLSSWVGACIERTGVSRVLAAGGVFMNVKANKAISELEQVEYFQAFPSCGDETLSMGACYLAAAEAGGEIEPLQHFYLGNDLEEDECRRAVADHPGLTVEKPADMAERVAGLLAAGHIVARAAGPMEFGARALGNRSILADPLNQDVVRVINHMIKKRDFWMPFAPVVLRREAAPYFSNPKDLPSPYMMNTFDATERKGQFMAAVHNADLTARPQLLEDGQNPGYQAILERFAAATGRHVLLNTSFNLHGWPIVCSATDAVKVLLDSGLECLVVGPLLVTKGQIEATAAP